jgi:hypothetical protein
MERGAWSRTFRRLRRACAVRSSRPHRLVRRGGRPPKNRRARRSIRRRAESLPGREQTCLRTSRRAFCQSRCRGTTLRVCLFFVPPSCGSWTSSGDACGGLELGQRRAKEVFEHLQLAFGFGHLLVDLSLAFGLVGDLSLEFRNALGALRDGIFERVALFGGVVARL